MEKRRISPRLNFLYTACRKLIWPVLEKKTLRVMQHGGGKSTKHNPQSTKHEAIVNREC